eukprot:3736103-Pyramimonas_sp.AAC.1
MPDAMVISFLGGRGIGAGSRLYKRRGVDRSRSMHRSVNVHFEARRDGRYDSIPNSKFLLAPMQQTKQHDKSAAQ